MTSHEETPAPESPDTPSLLPVAVKVVVYGGNLYTETGFPLYRYVPLADMVRRKLKIPWASEWGEYITAWVSNYVPLPRTTSEVPVVEAGLSFQARTGAKRDYEQTVYRGWPLYTCAYDAPGFMSEPQGTVPGLFELVSVEEPWVRDDQDSLPTWPNYSGGP